MALFVPCLVSEKPVHLPPASPLSVVVTKPALKDVRRRVPACILKCHRDSSSHLFVKTSDQSQQEEAELHSHRDFFKILATFERNGPNVQIPLQAPFSNGLIDRSPQQVPPKWDRNKKRVCFTAFQEMDRSIGISGYPCNGLQCNVSNAARRWDIIVIPSEITQPNHAL